ncbi:MAG: hypothetical protein IPN80_11025 [Flavobacterium sp.]|nr:hypothetical protein [Flavobacterium sp.]
MNYPGLLGGSTHTVTAKNGSGCISAASTITLDISPPTPNAPSIFTAQPDCTEAFGEITILNVAGETYSFDGGPYSPNLFTVILPLELIQYQQQTALVVFHQVQR